VSEQYLACLSTHNRSGAP